MGREEGVGETLNLELSWAEVQVVWGSWTCYWYLKGEKSYGNELLYLWSLILTLGIGMRTGLNCRTPGWCWRIGVRNIQASHLLNGKNRSHSEKNTQGHISFFSPCISLRRPPALSQLLARLPPTVPVCPPGEGRCPLVAEQWVWLSLVHVSRPNAVKSLVCRPSY